MLLYSIILHFTHLCECWLVVVTTLISIYISEYTSMNDDEIEKEQVKL